MIETSNKQAISVLMDETFEKVLVYGDDMVTSTDIQSMLHQNEFGHHPLTDINTLLLGWGFEGKKIPPTNEMLWLVKMK